MMAINILDLQPSVIDRSLSGKTLLLAGEPKIGKSEFIAQSPDTLIFDFENGYNAHPGVTAINVTKWSEIKTYLRQLEKPEAQKRYKNVAFDTVSEAWDLCTAFICQQAGVQKINEIPYGQGYKNRDDEFANVLRKIINLKYGLILTSHIKETVIGTKNDIDIIALAPNLDKRCLPIINGLVDIIGIITKSWNEQGESERFLLTKATPTIAAGSRWAHLEPKIPFGYAQLEKAVADAIAYSEKEGAVVVDKKEVIVEDTLNFTTVRAEAQNLWTTLIQADEANAEVILKKIEITMGRKMKLSEFTEDQVDLLALVVDEMNDMAKELNIKV